MPTGTGYFLGPAGEVIPIYEHLAAVEEAPARFGLRPEDIAPQGEEEARSRGVRRVRVLTRVLMNGFVRVRFEPRRRVVEYYADSPDMEARRLAVIGEFLKREGFKEGQVLVKNVWGFG